jgi:hypothetical protein
MIVEIIHVKENKGRMLVLWGKDHDAEKVFYTKKIVIASIREAMIIIIIATETPIAAWRFLPDTESPGFKIYDSAVMAPCFMGFYM